MQDLPPVSPPAEIKKVVPEKEWQIFKRTMLSAKTPPAVKIAMLKNYDINAVNAANGRTLLIEACGPEFDEPTESIEKIVAFLLDQKADPNKADNNGLTPLFFAALSSLPLMQLLVKAGANINHIPSAKKYNHTVLYALATKGEQKRLDFLLEHKADPNLKGDSLQIAPLYNAVTMAGQVGIVRSLLAHKATVDITTAIGETPLYGAVQEATLQSIGSGPSTGNYTEIVEVLLEAKANPNAKNANETSPLEDLVMKAEGKYNSVLQKLAASLHKSGAEINEPLERGATLLGIAVWHNNLPLAKQLLACGAAINQPTIGSDLQREGEYLSTSVLHVACSLGNHEMVRLLVNKGANKKAIMERTQHTPLHVACLQGHRKCAEILLQKFTGIDVNAKAADGSTPCHLAAQRGDVELVKLLYKNGARLNEIAPDGATPLFFASQEGHAEVVEFLLQNGADPNLRRKDGLTPLLIAYKYGHTAVVDLLLASSAQFYEQGRSGYALLMDLLFPGSVPKFSPQPLLPKKEKKAANPQATSLAIKLDAKTSAPTIEPYQAAPTAIAMTGRAFLKEQGFSPEEIEKLVAKKDKRQKKLRPSVAAQQKTEVVSWLDEVVTSDQGGIQPVESDSIPNCFLWLAEECIQNQVGDKAVVSKFKEVVPRFCAAFKKEGIKILSREEEIFIWVQMGDLVRKVPIKHELKIKTDSARILIFPLLADDGRSTLLVAAVYSDDGLHDERAINALRKKWTRENPLVIIPPAPTLKHTKEIMGALSAVGFLSSGSDPANLITDYYGSPRNI